jgi:hypothetical protein
MNDLAEIVGHITEDDADAASRFGSSLLDHVGLLTRVSAHGWRSGTSDYVRRRRRSAKPSNRGNSLRRRW